MKIHFKIFQFIDAKRAKELEEEEARRAEAARDQADAGSPHETGKLIFYLNMTLKIS